MNKNLTTDRIALGEFGRTPAYPADRPVTPADLVATILHLLGVPAAFGIRDQAGRPHLACEGAPVLGLLN